MRLALARTANILPMSGLDVLMFGYFRSLPHPRQKFCFCLMLFSQYEHGFGLDFVVRIWIFRSFSDNGSRIRVPRRMRTQPPKRWNTPMAASMPY